MFHGDAAQKLRASFITAVLLLVCACGSGDQTAQKTPTPHATLPPQQANSVEEFEVSVGTLDPPLQMDAMAYDSGEGFLEGPYFALKLSWLATGPAMPETRPFLASAGDIEPRRAVDGQELLVIGVDAAIRTGQWYPTEKASPQAELVVGDRTTPLKKLPLPPDASPLDTNVDSAILVASVPKGAPVRLRVTDEGRTQTLDVRTGQHASDAIAGYYRPYLQKLRWNGDTSAGISVQGGLDHFRVPLGVGLEGGLEPANIDKPTALLAPYVPSKGWAPDGQAWLVVPGPAVSGHMNIDEKPPVKLVANDPATFRLRLPDGTELNGDGGPRKIKTFLGHLTDPRDVIFQVPADFHKGSYLIDLAKTQPLAEYRDATLPGSWAPPPKTLEVPINVS